ncbi:ABC transporter permease [Devosia ginsengisoli]|uniref:ABC transporter permease n=1 Tax=Devosia ginsengisoli TaxID=400770 RepID=UPI0026EF7CEC|nr:ABC transporter permease [Devosia ginsengisoli]MCR6673571.1 ABC transporter permease [Devosia ginsengisoli]
MISFLLRRALATVPVIAIVMLAVFLVVHLGGSDPARIIAGDSAGAAEVETLREALGLNRPLPIQFLDWAGNTLRGDLGSSLFYGTPVVDMISVRIGPTIALAIGTLLFAVVLGVPMGTFAAVTAGRWPDKLLMGVASIGFSLPIFIVAYTLVYWLALVPGWFPVQGFTPPQTDFGQFLRGMTLPIITLGAFYMSLFARVSRAAVLDMLKEDFVRTARAKGATPLRVLTAHALRCAAVPIITIIGSSFAGLLGGVVVTETLFNIPGLGRLVTEAILKRDFPIIQGVILVTALIYIFVNMVVDMIYALLDPRIRQ